MLFLGVVQGRCTRNLKMSIKSQYFSVNKCHTLACIVLNTRPSSQNAVTFYFLNKLHNTRYQNISKLEAANNTHLSKS